MRYTQSTDGTYRDFSPKKLNILAAARNSLQPNLTPNYQILINSKEEEAVVRFQELNKQYKNL
jgi:hypothetical protein